MTSSEEQTRYLNAAFVEQHTKVKRLQGLLKSLCEAAEPFAAHRPDDDVSPYDPHGRHSATADWQDLVHELKAAKAVTSS